MTKLLFTFLGILRRIKLWRLKIRGKTESDVHRQRIVSGKAWDEFCENLKKAGGALLYGNAPRDAFNQAEGYRYLARLVRVGLENYIEFNDPEFPSLKRLVHETVKIGADNPDNFYQNSVISGDFEYKITGIRHSIPFLSFHIFNGQYGSAAGVHTCSELASSALVTDPDGKFEIIISKEKRGQNWMKIEKESSLLIVRRTHLNRPLEKPADISITCLNGRSTPPSLTPDQLDKALSTVSLFVGGVAIKFARWANSFTKHPNQLPIIDPKLLAGAGGDDNLVYFHSFYRLAQDECLVIDTPIPECEYWNFQLNNYWMESLDYRFHRIHLNKETATYRSDGSVQVVVSQNHIDHPNSLTTVGHSIGTMLWRWLKPDRSITPSCRVMKIQDFNTLQENAS